MNAKFTINCLPVYPTMKPERKLVGKIESRNVVLCGKSVALSNLSGNGLKRLKDIYIYKQIFLERSKLSKVLTVVLVYPCLYRLFNWFQITFSIKHKLEWQNLVKLFSVVTNIMSQMSCPVTRGGGGGHKQVFTILSVWGLLPL